MSYITSFNNQVDNFLNYIIDEFPDENNFILFKTFIIRMRKVNSIQIVKNFMEYLEPHKEIIYSENDKFFLEYDFNIYGNDASKHSLELKDIYMNCKNEKVKKNIWKYLQVLLKLGEKANLK
jgi:hypothetical protein